MKSRIQGLWVFIVLIIVGLTSISHAEGGNFGLGLAFGNPSGLTAKLWLDKKTALDFFIGWSDRYGYDRYGGYYNDNRCYNGKYYNDNRSYCSNQSYGRYRGYGYRFFHMHGNFLFHNHDLIKSRQKFSLYWGPGINFDYWRDANLSNASEFGIRVTGGIAWRSPREYWEIHLDLGPVFLFYPVFFEPGMTASLGARYYF